MSESDIGYLVLERCWEYGDTYYQPENCGSNVHKFFWDREKADECALKKNIAKFKGLYVCEYGYDSNEITSLTDSELQRALGKLGLNWDGDWDDFCIPSSLSDKKLIEMIKIFDHIEFFYVEEVEMVD